jgi:hypothetical protein
VLVSQEHVLSRELGEKALLEARDRSDVKRKEAADLLSAFEKASVEEIRLRKLREDERLAASEVNPPSETPWPTVTGWEERRAGDTKWREDKAEALALKDVKMQALERRVEEQQAEMAARQLAAEEMEARHVEAQEELNAGIERLQQAEAAILDMWEESQQGQGAVAAHVEAEARRNMELRDQQAREGGALLEQCHALEEALAAERTEANPTLPPTRHR